MLDVLQLCTASAPVTVLLSMLHAEFQGVTCDPIKGVRQPNAGKVTP
jgi:hypothetical protein